MPLPVIFRTSVFQLTILYVVLFGVSVATLGGVIYVTTVGYLRGQTDEVIRAEMNGLAEQYIQRGFGALRELIRDRGRRSTGERFSYLLIDYDGNPLAGNVRYWPAPPELIEGWFDFEPEVVDASGATERVPVRALILPVGRFEETGLRILVGREIRELAEINRLFIRAFVLSGALTMCLALAGGLVLAFSAQRRVTELSRTTRRIIAGDLSQRVPIGGANDEHADLARSVNAMLDQIENLMAGLRHVGDSIAHDLRGPLTRLRTRLEQLADEATPSHATIDACLAQADGVLATFNALLRIARVESGAYRRAFATIDLAPIARDVADLYQATADDNVVEIRRRIADEAMVFGDRELLAQALTNLLDNALKYTPVGGRIDFELKRSGGSIVVVVADSGPGIPSEARERVLQRFARLDESRSKPGNGLGLALVRAVSDQHEGELTLGDNAPGLRVTLTLPAAGPDNPARSHAGQATPQTDAR